MSLTEQYGKGVQNTAKKLIKENMYDFVGSDTHHNKHLSLLKNIVLRKKETEVLETLVLRNKQFKKG